MSNSHIQTRWTSHHDHTFGQHKPTANERRTAMVVVLTAVTMVVEIAAGTVYGSMALLADGLHMASHAVALGIAAFAYRYARKHAQDAGFSFGTGKVNALTGYSGAILLGVFALGMAVENVDRFSHPVAFAIDQALVVAVPGLLINRASVGILGLEGHGDEHHHHGDGEHHHHHDHNFRSAYFHVLADALTSLLAIVALLAARFVGLTWLDPLMGVVGALLVARWSMGLLRQSGQVLLDRQAPEPVLNRMPTALESSNGTRVVDLHVWAIGPGKRAAIVALEAPLPRSLREYRAMVPRDVAINHLTIEIEQRGY